MKIEEGVSNSIIAIVVVLCAAPAATLNIWPRVAQMLQEGMSGSQVGIVLLVAVSALGMAATPFAMKKAENWGFWITCLAFGVGLAVLNYAMAVGAVGKVRDNEADGARAKQARYLSLKRAVEDAEGARKNLPAFTPTTKEMVATGEAAVNFAIQARDQECRIVGDICRARIAQLASRQSELANLSRDFALTERAMALDRHLSEARAQLAATAPAPMYVDAQASRLAALVAGFIDLGPDAAERVANALVSILAISAEAIALGLPRIIVTALTRPVRREPLVAIAASGPEGKGPAPPAAEKPAAQNPGNAAPAAVPRRKTPNRPPALISLWRSDGNISSRAGSRVNCWTAYTAYKDWAEARRQNPADFAAFCSELKLPVSETPPTAASFFLDTELPRKLKVVS